MLSRRVCALLLPLCLACESGGEGAGSGGSEGGLGGAGGATSFESWEEVRCWQHDVNGSLICFARIGNLWASAVPACAVEGVVHQPMRLNETECGGEDDDAGWDETFCDDSQCYGRLGDWLTVLVAPCQIPEHTTLDTTPSEHYCEGPPETPIGWDDVECFTEGGGFLYCFGSRGAYVPGWGLNPTCYVEESMARNVEYSEITLDPHDCR